MCVFCVFLFFLTVNIIRRGTRSGLYCTILFNAVVTSYADVVLTMEFVKRGARCSSVVRAFAHGAMGRRIDPLWGGPIELFLVPASATRLV